jgi:hypothetical protein
VFETRADSPELLDMADLGETLALQSYRFMSIVNKFFGGTAIVRDFIANEVTLQKRSEPLKILDIGSGICDIPAAVCQWANSGLNLKFTCVEPNGFAAEAAKMNIGQHPNIKLVQQDIFDYRPTERYDCATGSLFFHHLTDKQIIELIERLRSFGCRSILINDLHRSLCCYAGCLAVSMFLPAGVRHDALLSIRRSFRPEDLDNLLKSYANVTVGTRWFGRVYAVIRFDTEDD